MFLSNASTRRPIAMTTAVLCLLLFGYLAYRTVGVDLMPRVELPYVTVLTFYPGASADEIETTVARKIEDAVVSIDGIKHIDTTCLNNLCQVMIEFNLGRNVDDAATDVREKINLIRNDLPDAAEDPEILKYDINARPVVTVALTGSVSQDELYDYADNTLKDRYSTLPGVANVELIGGAVREVHVVVDRAKLASRGLTLGQVANAVGRENVKIPIGQIEEGAREFPVMFDAEAPTVPELGAIQVGVVQGQRVYLRDIADIRMGTERVTTRAFIDGRACIALKIAKKGEANAVKVVDAVAQATQNTRGTLPGGMELTWFRDDGAFVRATVEDANSSIWQGVLLTGIVLMLFLGDIRTAVVAFVSIPASILIAYIAFGWFGYTLNTPTMSAMGISVGILVTNSIVVLENIAKHLGHDTGANRSVVERATSAVGLAVAASALTNVVVFVPVAMMKSITGRFLGPFAVTVTAATLASLFVSFTLTPILAIVLLGHGARLNAWFTRLLRPWERMYGRFEKLYFGSLLATARRPMRLIAVMVLLSVVLFVLVVPRVGKDFVPTMDQGELAIRLEYPSDSNLARTTERVLALTRQVKADPAVRNLLVTVGKTQGMFGLVSEGAYLAEITVRLTPKTERRETIRVITDRLRRMVANEPDCIASVAVPSAAGGSQQQLEAIVSGPDLSELNRIGLATARALRDDPSAVDVAHSVRMGRPEIRVRPERAILHDMGVSASDLGLSLRANVEGVTPAVFKRGDRSFNIRVKLAEEEGKHQVAAMNLPSKDGLPVALDAVASVREGVQPTQIIRSEKQRVVRIYANPATGSALGTLGARARQIIEPQLPAGYHLRLGGMAEKMGDAFADFKTASLIAVLLTYLLLAAMLESWTQPFMIMMTVPFAYLGLFLALFLTHSTMSIFGLLAGVMLIGVVVNNAILLIDEINTLRRGQGVCKRQALLLASRRKFRPIVMTSLAAVLGMLPMAMGSGLGSELRASIGIGSVGGMVVSTLLSLYFIPALYLVAGQRNRVRGA
jgi:HAE1 family hydrophobic/amphiphilic exporter-1